MSARWIYAVVGLVALAAGAALWMANRPEGSVRPVADIGPTALYAASFRDASGQAQALGQFQRQVLVLNFWATWCAPCREEMPAFVRLQERWAGRGVRFVGLSSEAPEKAAHFAAEHRINYPLWTGGDEVAELSRRLGNRLGVLPHTAIVAPGGRVLEVKVGPYTEAELETLLENLVAKSA